MDAQLRKYLEAGHTLADAAAYAGLSYDLARQQLSAATDDSDLEAQRLALAPRVRAALETLEDLLGADDERTRLGAAKAILDLQTKHRPKRIQIESENRGDDLWTLATRKSVDGYGSEAGMSEQVDRSCPEQGFEAPLGGADNRGEPTGPCDIREDAELCSGDMPTGALDFEPCEPSALQDADHIRPAAHRARLENRVTCPPLPNHAPDRETHGEDVSLFDYL